MHIGERAIGVERQHPVGWIGDLGHGQRAPLCIRVVEQYARRRWAQCPAQGHRIGVVHCHRGLVHRAHRDGHGRRRRVQDAIAHPVGEAVTAARAAVMHVGERAIGVKRQGAVPRVGDGDGDEGVAIGVRIVGQDPRRRLAQRAALGHHIGVVHRHRRLVRRAHGEGHRRHVRVQGSIVGLVGEAVAAGRTAVVRIGEGAVDRQRQHAVGRSAELDRGQRAAFRVRIVAEHAGGRRAERPTVHHHIGVGEGQRRVVHDGQVEGHGDGAAVEAPIVGPVREAVRRGFAAIVDVGERAVGAERQRAVGRMAQPDRSQRIAIRIRIVAEHARGRQDERTTRAERIGVMHRRRRLIRRGHGDRHRRHVRVEGAVVGLVGEAVSTGRTAVVRIREGPVDTQRQGAVARTAERNRGQGGAQFIRVVAQHAGGRRAERPAPDDRVGVGHCHRRHTEAGHGDRHRRHVRIQGAVIRHIGETVMDNAEGVDEGRRVGERAVGIEHQRPLERVGDLHRGQRAAGGASVVAEHARRSGAQYLVLGHRVGVVDRDRRCGQRGHGEGHGDGAAVEAPIVGPVREAVRRGFAAIVDVGERAVGAERQRAVGRMAQPDRSQRIAIRIRIVAEHARGRQDERTTRAERIGVMHRRRRLIRRGHGDRHRRHVRVEGAVVGLVGEAVSTGRTAVVRIREGPVDTQRQGAVARTAERNRGQGGAQFIRVVAQHAGGRRAERPAPDDRVGVGHCHRRHTEAGHGDRHRRHVRIQGAVIRHIGETVMDNAEGVDEGRRVGERAVGIEHQRPLERVGDLHRGQRAAGGASVVGEHPRRSGAQRPILGGRIGIVHRDRRGGPHRR